VSFAVDKKRCWDRAIRIAKIIFIPEPALDLNNSRTWKTFEPDHSTQLDGEFWKRVNLESPLMMNLGTTVLATMSRTSWGIISGGGFCPPNAPGNRDT
jgi:hypothetical protein